MQSPYIISRFMLKFTQIDYLLIWYDIPKRSTIESDYLVRYIFNVEIRCLMTN